jgi:hypothetical protein
MPNPANDARLNELNQQIAQLKQQIGEPTIQQPDWWSTTNAMTMSAVFLAFGAFVILIAAFLVRFGKSAESVLRIFGTILIVITAVPRKNSVRAEIIDISGCRCQVSSP